MQNNLNRSRLTQDIVFGIAARENVDIIILNEPNKRVVQTQGWYIDHRTDAIIIIRNNNIPVYNKGKGDEFAWMETEYFVIYSCYSSPNIDMQMFHQFLIELVHDVRQHNKPVIVEGT